MKRKQEQPSGEPAEDGEPVPPAGEDGEPMPKRQMFRPWESPPHPPPSRPLHVQQSTSNSENSAPRIKLEKTYQAFGRNIWYVHRN